MAPRPSKKTSKTTKPQKRTTKTQKKSNAVKTHKKPQKSHSNGKIRQFFQKNRQKFSRPTKVNPHKSFRRSYREDYKRETNVPGILHHIFASFGMIFKNWKLFLPFLIIIVILDVLFVGIMEETDYVDYQETLDQTSLQVAGGDIGNFAKAGLILISTVTTGGLSGESSEAAMVFSVIIFLIIWLVTIFLLRHLLAGHKVKLRDGLYNAMTPLISTFLVLLVAIIQCIPIFILIVVYSAAVQTDFLATPFYALLFFIFASLMIILSGYLLSSSLIALIAVSAPGLYPMRALHTASDLMIGRRIKFILRLIALIIVLALIWVIIMLPLILFDMWIKQFEWTAGVPFIPICLTTMTCFTAIYITVYLYMYYRWMLDS